MHCVVYACACKSQILDLIYRFCSRQISAADMDMVRWPGRTHRYIKVAEALTLTPTLTSCMRVGRCWRPTRDCSWARGCWSAPYGIFSACP